MSQTLQPIDDAAANPAPNAGAAAPRQGFARGGPANNANQRGGPFLAGGGGRRAAQQPPGPAMGVRPTQAVPPQPTQADKDEWAAQFFRKRGWESKKAQQDTLKTALTTMVGNMMDPRGPNSANALTKEDLKPGRNFTNYLASLTSYELAKQPRDPSFSADLKAKAETVKAGYEASSKESQKDKKNRRKYQVCLDALTRLDMEAKLRDLGDPPWDSKKAMTAASLKAQADFASLPVGQQRAEELKGGGVNSAFWINTAGDGRAKQEKSFLFKPATDKQDRIGIPRGGEPAREALTGRAADVLNGMTGIDFKVPETHIIQVAHDKFPGGTLGSDVVDRDGPGPLTGSLQQFSNTDGELRDQSPLKASAVPPERCQELAILDVVTLSVDRHGGNFLMTGDNKTADMIPIDNGLSFPSSTEEFGRICTSHNALLGVPGAHEPFSAKMLQKIANIDAGALAKALRSEVGTIESVHPSAQGKVDDAAIEMSRRSTMFLKLAAPTLSPAAVQVAMGQNASALFDPAIDDAEFQRRAAQAVTAMAADQDGVKNFCLMSVEEKAEAQEAIMNAGWDKGFASNPQLAAALFKQGAPAAPTTAAAPVDPATITRAEVAQMNSVYPTAKSPKDIPAWRQFSQAGGTAVLKRVLDALVSDGKEREFYLEMYVEDAVKLMAQYAAATAVKAAANQVAGNPALLDAKHDLVKKMAALMDSSIQPIVLREAQTARNSGDARELNKVRDQAIATLQHEMLPELEKVWKWGERTVGEDIKYAGMDKTKKDLLAGAVLSTRGELDKLKQRWAYPG